MSFETTKISQRFDFNVDFIIMLLDIVTKFFAINHYLYLPNETVTATQ